MTVNTKAIHNTGRLDFFRIRKRAHCPSWEASSH